MFSQFGYNILIDSGSTISYINNKIFDEILNIMNEECKKFVDKDMFEPQFHKYIRVIKVKIWYGTCSGNGENISGKYITLKHNNE